MKAVILAAGKGTRMRAVSFGLPKLLLPLGEKTIGDNLVQGFKEAGVSEILIIVGHMEEQIRDHFADGSHLGVRIHYRRQDDPLGTGHAAALARDFASEEPFFALAYGDIATPASNCAGLVSDFRERSPEASLSIHRVKDPAKGAAVYVEDGYMRSLVEKPPKGSSTTQFDNAGIYVFTPNVFDMLDRVDLSPREEYELTDALTLLVENGHKVGAYELSGFWSNVSFPEDLLDVNRIVIDGLSSRRGKNAPKAAPGVEVSSLASVHPRAMLGKCSIGAYTVVDQGAQVMDGAKVTHAIICRNAIVREGAFLDHVLVRPGCTVKPATTYQGSEEKVLILPDEG